MEPALEAPDKRIEDLIYVLALPYSNLNIKINIILKYFSLVKFMVLLFFRLKARDLAKPKYCRQIFCSLRANIKKIVEL